MALVGGVYRKPLPAPAVALSSPEGRAIFQEALKEGTAEAFFPLIEQFRTQDEPAFCGPGTLVMVLNALSMDPGTLWKGTWRWYHERSLDCCKDPDEIAKDGIDWEEWLCLARCQGLATTAVRADETTASLVGFEEQIASSCSKSAGEALVIAYSRKGVGQAGDGHYSPIGGYHRGRSLALVLDTARFKYPPHWLPVTALWEAMRLTNSGTGRSRGYVLLTRGHASAPSSCCSLKLTWPTWRTLTSWISQELPKLIAAAESTIEAELWAFARGLPASVAALIQSFSQIPGTDSTSERVLQALHATQPFALLSGASKKKPGYTLPTSLESLSILLLLLGQLGLLEALPRATGAKLWHVEKGVLAEELQSLKEKAEEVMKVSSAKESCSSCCSDDCSVADGSKEPAAKRPKCG